MTLASTKIDPLSSVKQVQTVEINREVNDSAVWSNDQFNYFLSDMMLEMEGKRNNSRPDMQRTDDFSTEDQLCLLQNTMHRSNPNVLSVRYLSFLRDHDYQDALDSLHQYHDALSPLQDQSLNDSDGNDGNRLPSAPSQIVGSHC
ncbi:hypothetical protein PsorP6_005666 [Peronosclerospora sorghi]|uniref:Uncharacterized protein n=1 Tax=Peronosclerospora sorghi TaxID=230839 RepID=A0ACC0W2R0_9STRA|nr:hypothetical protein PsorP6_005666 [Peronosclerospora sorghi]